MEGDVPGWPESAYDTLLRLEGDPSPRDLERCRAEHERLVRQPMERLCEALGVVGGFNRAYISGLGPGASPRQWQCTDGTVWIARRVRMSVRFDLDGLRVEGGWTGAASDQLPRYRSAVAAEHTGTELAELVAELDRSGYAVARQSTRKVPRGFPSEHPRADLLRSRSLFAQLDLGAGAWLHTAEVVDRVRGAFDPMVPLASWFVEFVAFNGFSAVT